jgi:uncharacterized protein DUF5329
MKHFFILGILIALLSGCGRPERTLPPEPPANAEANVLSEDEKIEALILALKQLTGATFIRNGKEHTLDEAIAHMRTKWEWKKSEIKTAEDFIRVAASKSSMSGDPYIIRFADGTQRQAGEWFREQLDEKPGD